MIELYTMREVSLSGRKDGGVSWAVCMECALLHDVGPGVRSSNKCFESFLACPRRGLCMFEACWMFYVIHTSSRTRFFLVPIQFQLLSNFSQVAWTRSTTAGICYSTKCLELGPNSYWVNTPKRPLIPQSLADFISAFASFRCCL